MAEPGPPRPSRAPPGRGARPPFVRELVKVLRAQDTARGTAVPTRRCSRRTCSTPPRREAPDPRRPDPETLWRLDLFYNAVGLAIERQTGIMVTPLTKMHHEGFGRMVLAAGRLIVVNRQLRDVHRFGFPTLAKLADAGAKLVADGVTMIRTFPEGGAGEPDVTTTDEAEGDAQAPERAGASAGERWTCDLSRSSPTNWERIPETAQPRTTRTGRSRRPWDVAAAGA